MGKRGLICSVLASIGELLTEESDKYTLYLRKLWEVIVQVSKVI